MKTITIFCLLVFIFLGFFACGTDMENGSPDAVVMDDSETTSATEDAIPNEYIDGIQSQIESEFRGLDCAIYVFERNGAADIHFTMTGGMPKWLFVDVVIRLTEVTSRVLNEYNVPIEVLSATFNVESVINGEVNTQVISWRSKDLLTGFLFDDVDVDTEVVRSGITIEELIAMYDYS